MMLIFNQSIASGFNHPDTVWRCGEPDLRVEEVKILNSDTGAGGGDVLEGPENLNQSIKDRGLFSLKF